MGDPASEKLSSTSVYRSGAPLRAGILTPLAAVLLLGMTGAVGADSGAPPPDDAKVRVLALYIPLADHYAALVAFERYRDQMQYADFQIEKMPNRDLLRAKFRSGQAEMAFVIRGRTGTTTRLRGGFGQ